MCVTHLQNALCSSELAALTPQPNHLCQRVSVQDMPTVFPEEHSIHMHTVYTIRQNNMYPSSMISSMYLRSFDVTLFMERPKVWHNVFSPVPTSNVLAESNQASLPPWTTEPKCGASLHMEQWWKCKIFLIINLCGVYQKYYPFTGLLYSYESHSEVWCLQVWVGQTKYSGALRTALPAALCQPQDGKKQDDDKMVGEKLFSLTNHSITNVFVSWVYK